MKIVTIPCLFDNYGYLIICEETGEAAVVDPAEFYPVLSEINNSGVRLQAVYCTHHHADHIGGLEELRGEYPGLSVYGYGTDKERIKGMNCGLADGDKIRIGTIEGRVMHTPGHTTGSLCYLFEDALFTGDTLFGGGCGRLFEGSPQQMYEGLNMNIKSLPEKTRVYFGHEYTVSNLKFASYIEPGNKLVGSRLELMTTDRENGSPTTPSTLHDENATNPFLRCEEEGVIRSVAEKFFGEGPDPLAVFTALRRLKDSY